MLPYAWSIQFSREDGTYFWFVVRLNLNLFWYVQELFLRPILKVENTGILPLLDDEGINVRKS